MARHILTISGLGEKACWLLVQQAMGMPEAKMCTNFMADRVAMLIFAENSLAERLCVSAAVRQMSGSVVYEGTGTVWRKEVAAFRDQLMPIFSYYVDCLYTYGLAVGSWDPTRLDLRFPVINAGSPDAHPAHALADIACMLRNSRNLQGLTCAWIGCLNGTLHSLITATAWFPFALRVALPEHVDRRPLEKEVARLGTNVVFVDTPEEAAQGVDYVFVGCRGGLTAEEYEDWSVSAELLAKAKPNVRVMLSASPADALMVGSNILRNNKTSILVQQSEYRLRVHKRMLHWVFLDNEDKG
ncbi:MAG: ornithine carbamoyltransferase [Desulfovibrio sp.]|nr:ornithine carbamoyltransferase [Desulfovibrio sp.]